MAKREPPPEPDRTTRDPVTGEWRDDYQPKPKPKRDYDSNTRYGPRPDTDHNADQSDEPPPEPDRNSEDHPHTGEQRFDYQGRSKPNGQAEPDDQEPWPDPQSILTPLPPVKRFDAGMLPEALAAYVFDIAERQQCPVDFVAVAALVGLSGLAGNRIRIAPKQHDDWEVVPNLWGALIGRPGSMKTPAIKAALAPLYAIEKQLREEWTEARHAADIDAELTKLKRKDAGKRASKAYGKGDKAAARDILSEVEDDDDSGSPCPRLIVNDATVEKLGELLNENPRGLILVRDELHGWIARMENERYQEDRSFYLEAWTGDTSFVYDRIGRGTIPIEHATLSIIGGIQPSRIAALVHAAVTGARDDGMIQRLQLAVWPDRRSVWKWVDRHPNADNRKTYAQVFERIHALSAAQTVPLVLRFSLDAQDLYQAWMEMIHHQDIDGGELSPVMESHLLKMPQTVASLALIFELAETMPDKLFEVGIPALERALDWAGYLRNHADRLYASGRSLVEDGARLIIERRRQLPETFSLRDIHQKQWAGLTDREVVEEATEHLIEACYCRRIVTPESSSGGRPSNKFVWNPKLEKN
ncbi:YfjI family protein [Sinorhizobium chiapasense]|uniref:YfjI family protein n=1 Tax=Sinorhizobium chiapasense TaxID=501572 RepID=A0ABZ2B842_9HYPH